MSANTIASGALTWSPGAIYSQQGDTEYIADPQGNAASQRLCALTFYVPPA